MAAQAALIADTIIGMKRALRRETEYSGPDEPITQPTNRGNKLRANAKYVREGALGYIHPEHLYKQVTWPTFRTFVFEISMLARGATGTEWADMGSRKSNMPDTLAISFNVIRCATIQKVTSLMRMMKTRRRMRLLLKRIHSPKSLWKVRNCPLSLVQQYSR